MQKIINDITAEITAKRSKLAEAQEAAKAITELEGDIARLSAALKDLGAPQSPDGRKAIGSARRKRAAKVEAEPTMTGAEGLLDEIVANSAQSIAPAKTNLCPLCPHCSRPLLSIDAFSCPGGCGAKFHRLCAEAHHFDGGTYICPEVKA